MKRALLGLFLWIFVCSLFLLCGCNATEYMKEINSTFPNAQVTTVPDFPRKFIIVDNGKMFFYDPESSTNMTLIMIINFPNQTPEKP